MKIYGIWDRITVCRYGQRKIMVTTGFKHPQMFSAKNLVFISNTKSWLQGKAYRKIK